MHDLQPLGETLDVVFECAEGHVAVLFSRTFADRSPQVPLFKSFESENVVTFADVETEFAVEAFRSSEVRHHEMKMIDRMDTEFAGPSVGRDEPLDRCHRVPLP